jgi:hypothetical protein
MKELERFGTFKDGVFRRNEDAEGKRNLDGYQAIWEHVHGRRLDYPTPRYPAPIMMDPSNFAWTRSREEAGVWEKRLGSFTERGAVAGYLRIDAGASSILPERSIHVCLSGTGSVDGEPCRSLSVIHLAQDETARLEAADECTFLRMLLPDLSGLTLSAGEVPSIAAE